MEIILLISSLAVYFVPTILAVNLKHQRKDLIFFLNLLLGWTLVGWVAALIWAFFGKNNYKAFKEAEDAKFKAEATAHEKKQAELRVVGGKDAPDELEKWHKLKKAGAISEEDYRLKKLALLGVTEDTQQRDAG